MAKKTKPQPVPYGERLRAARDTTGQSQTELAASIGRPKWQGVVSDHENKSEPPEALVNLALICWGLGITLDELMEGLF